MTTSLATTAAPPTRRRENGPVWAAWLAWAGPLAAAVVGGVLRFTALGRPHAMVFDETYYAKDALSLLRFGYEQQTLDDADEIVLGSDGAWRTLDIFTGEPSFVVHPPAGKWIIAFGEFSLGMTPTGWRIMVALAGTLSILLLGRIVVRLTGNALLGTLAALLLALDGIAIVMSRTAVLDGLLALFVLAAFGALLLQRDRDRERLPGVASGSWWRPWWAVAGVSLGIACSVKWSGLWYVAAFGLLAMAWSLGRRRRSGVGHPWWATLAHDLGPAVLLLVAVPALVYLGTWAGWILTDAGWSRQVGAESAPGLTQWLTALVHYHREMWGFHVSLDSEHSYESSAWGWLLQARPTSMYYESVSNSEVIEGVICRAETCSSAVAAIGNPMIWWLGIAALIHQSYRAVFVRDGRSTAVIVGVLAGWAPWLLYPERTIFAFYSVVFLPFVVMALTMSLGQILGPATATPRRRAIGILTVTLVVLLVVAAAWWMYPVWTGTPLDTDQWRQRMWLPSWI